MKDYLEKNQDTATKEKKRRKTSSPPCLDFISRWFLSASTTDCRSAASSINPELKFILEQPSLLSQRNTLNHVLQMMDCMVNVSAALVTFLVTGDWIMINSNKPGKVSVMLLGRVVKPSDSKDTLKSCVRMKIQQIKGDVWAKYLIEKWANSSSAR